MLEKIKDFLFQNTTARQTVAKNTIWLTISSFGSRLIKIVIIIYAARVLGAAGYGVFSYAVTLAGFFGLFVDPGISSVLIRDGSKASPDEQRSFFSTAIVIKGIILAISVLVIITIAPFFSTLPGAKALLPLVAVILIFDTIRDFFALWFRARENMQWDAFSYLGENAGIVIFGFIFLAIAATPISFTAAYVAGAAVGALMAIWFMRKNFAVIRSGASMSRTISILKAAWPFAVTGALGVLLTNTDILIISWMRTAAEVGVYSAAIRIVQTLYLVPGIIQLSTLPLFARLAKQDNERFKTIFERTITLIFLVSLPVSVGGAILGAQIMGLVFGPAYIVGGVALSVLMLNVSFDYAGSVIASGIFAYDHQKSLIVSSAIAGFGNVLFDLILIPRWGIAGSAVATLIAQILSNSYMWYAMRKLNRFSIIPRLGRIVLATAVMGITTTFLFIEGLSVIPNVLISAGVYVGILYFFREPVLREIKSILRLSARPVEA